MLKIETMLLDYNTNYLREKKFAKKVPIEKERLPSLNYLLSGIKIVWVEPISFTK